MSRLLIKEREEKELRRLQASLINTSKAEAKSCAVSKKDAHRLVSLIGTILPKSRLSSTVTSPPTMRQNWRDLPPVIIEMLKSGGLMGHMVGKHWRVKKDSLVEYINNRDQASRIAQSEDEDGFGVDE